VSLPPLASASDLTVRAPATGATPDQIDAALVDASAAVRGYTGQTFNRTDTTDVLRTTCCGRLRLPQRPVHDVATVTTPDGDPVSWDWIVGTDRLEVASLARTFAVTYDHGYDDGEIPDDIVAVVCNVAARTLGQPREDAGITQRSITNYSESFGAVGAAGPVGLFEDERKALDRYRRIGVSAQVCIR
jgi:hypothetical protein